MIESLRPKPPEKGEKETVLKQLNDLIEESLPFLDRHNLQAHYNPELSLIYFSDKNGIEPSIVNLNNVRVPYFDSGELSETIVHSTPCVGIFIPDSDLISTELKNANIEPKRELIKIIAYQKAEKALNLIKPKTGQFPLDYENLIIATATSGQVSLWQKLGFLNEIETCIEGGPSLSTIINTLFYNDFEPLKKLGISFRTRNIIIPGLDILFYTRDENGLAHPAGLNLIGFGKNLSEPVEYENVVGVLSVPNEMPLSERKKISRRLIRSLSYWLKDPNVNVLTVDDNLIQFWLTKQRLLGSVKNNLENEQADRKKIDYGQRLKKPISGSIVLFEPKSFVGGPQLLLDLNLGSNVKSALLLDWGLPYLDEALMNLGNRPNYTNGINPFLRNGMLPEIRRLYRIDLLENSLTPQMLNVVLKGEYSFIVGELFHRLGKKQFLELVESKFPSLYQQINMEDFAENLEQIENKYYADKRIFEGVAISHGHTDHYGGLFSIRYDIPAFMSPETYTFIQSRFRQPGTWMDEHIIRRVRENEKKPPYDLEKRLVKFLLEPTWERIAPFFSISSLPLDHSLIGTQGFLVAITDIKGNPLYKICYLSDFRDGPMTQSSLQIVQSERPDFLIVEGTNIAAEKVSSQFNETQVIENIAKYLNEADRNKNSYFIIEIPLNHLERLNNIVELTLSGSSRRIVAIPLQMAQILHEFYILNENLTLERRIALPQLNQDVVLYYQNKTHYDPWEIQLIDQYNGKNIAELSLAPGDYIFIKSPYILLENLFSGLLGKDTKGYIIRATYWPYDNISKSMTLSNYRFAMANGLIYLSDIDLSKNIGSLILKNHI